MTDEERIKRLEKQVRNFRIVSAGNGHIEGGFASLPRTDDINARLANLENAAAKFSLAGYNVEVSGSFDSGFILT